MLKIHSIAEQARVNKALIYRYFGGLEGLIRAYADSQDFWPEVNELLGNDKEQDALFQKPSKAILRTILANHLTALKKRPTTLAVMAQECVERNQLTSILEDVRERRAMELQNVLIKHLQKAGRSESEIKRIFGLGAILSAALQYFLIRSRFIKIYGGLDIQSDSGHEQILDIIEENL